jgi:hypothetical protein
MKSKNKINQKYIDLYYLFKPSTWVIMLALYIEKLQSLIPDKSNAEGWNQEKKINYTKGSKK